MISNQGQLQQSLRKHHLFVFNHSACFNGMPPGLWNYAVALLLKSWNSGQILTIFCGHQQLFLALELLSRMDCSFLNSHFTFYYLFQSLFFCKFTLRQLSSLSLMYLSNGEHPDICQLKKKKKKCSFQKLSRMGC